MNALSHLKLASSRGTPVESAPRGEHRFRIEIAGRSGTAPGIRVLDKLRGVEVLSWRGPVARRLLKSTALPLASLQNGRYDCDKHLMQRLAMAGAAASSGLAEHPPANDALPDARQKASDQKGDPPFAMWNPLHTAVTSVLEEFPKQHLAEDDVVCLLLFRFPCVSKHQVSKVLADLAEWNQVQPIVVPTGDVHYDLDTRPHLHVYDARTRELRDAPKSGVLQAIGSVS